VQRHRQVRQPSLGRQDAAAEDPDGLAPTVTIAPASIGRLIEVLNRIVINTIAPSSATSAETPATARLRWIKRIRRGRSMIAS
jgi:hypothetical protein